MTARQAQARLNRADVRLRMAGVSNLGMWAIQQNGSRQIRKLYKATLDYWSALLMLEGEQAKKGKAR